LKNCSKRTVYATAQQPWTRVKLHAMRPWRKKETVEDAENAGTSQTNLLFTLYITPLQ